MLVELYIYLSILHRGTRRLKMVDLGITRDSPVLTGYYVGIHVCVDSTQRLKIVDLGITHDSLFSLAILLVGIHVSIPQRGRVDLAAENTELRNQHAIHCANSDVHPRMVLHATCNPPFIRVHASQSDFFLIKM